MNSKPKTLIIAAGIRGSKRIINQSQPFLKLDNKTVIERVVEAAINTKLVNKIFIWGPINRLQDCLQKALLASPKPITLVPERKDIINSLIYTYLSSFEDSVIEQHTSNTDDYSQLNWQHLNQQLNQYQQEQQQLNLILSDTPFITAKEIDHFLAHKSAGYDLLLGRTTMESLQQVLGSDFEWVRAVKNAYQYSHQRQSVRLVVNSFFCGFPLRFGLPHWQLIHVIYHNRTIIQGGKLNFKKIKNNLRAMRRFFAERTKNKRSAIDNFSSIYFLSKSYLDVVRNRRRQDLVAIADLEKHIHYLTNLKIGYMISNHPGAALDIDNDYEYQYYCDHRQAIEARIKQLG